MESSTQSVRRVIMLLQPNVHLLDVAGVAQVFHDASVYGVRYDLQFCATSPAVTSAQGLQLGALGPLPEVERGDMVVVPGLHAEGYRFDLLAVQPEIVNWLRTAAECGAEIVSGCTGAFVLGAAGLLDGRRCTTHWAIARMLQRSFPKALVQEKVLFLRDRGVTTSAGIAAGIDMALWLLEQDQGPLIAAQVARHLVVYMRRNGAHDQSSIYLEFRTHLNPGVHRAQDYLTSHVTDTVSLDQLARVAQTSPRSLSRAFRAATNLTPTQYHQRLRLEFASSLLDNPNLSIDEVAARSGFEDARHFRRLWQRTFGVPPSVSRAQAGQRPALPTF